jgi:cyclopropane fatty-acyl-phospholipid synthase-like methyltransferase
MRRQRTHPRGPGGLVMDEMAARNERYRVVEQGAMRRAEARVSGCDYGATSYTTRAQADDMARRLALAPRGGLLLDVGSGAGWPGIYMAAVTGARVVLSDIPWEGLRVATRRLTGDGVAGHVVAASAGALPFRDESLRGDEFRCPVLTGGRALPC